MFKVENLNWLYVIPGSLALLPVVIYPPIDDATMALAVVAVAAYTLGYLLWALGTCFGARKTRHIRWLPWLDAISNSDSRMYEYLWMYVNEIDGMLDRLVTRHPKHRPMIPAPPDGPHSAEAGALLWKLLRSDLQAAASSPHPLGAYLSSWNNVKFAQATFVALHVTGLLWVVVLGAKSCNLGLLPSALMIGGGVMVVAPLIWGYKKVVDWRLRVLARDLVYGWYGVCWHLSPAAPNIAHAPKADKVTEGDDTGQEA